MKNLSVILSLCAVLSACATGQSGSTKESSSTGNAAQATPTTSPHRFRLQAMQAGPGENLPSVQLTQDTMFRFLSAEIAEQRGDWEYAFVNMLQAARETGDPRLARRAAEIAIGARQKTEALAAIKLWREISPHSDDAIQLQLGMALMEGDFADARPILEDRLKSAKAPMLPATILQVQRLLSRTADKAAALQLLDEVLAPYPQLQETHLALAQAAYGAGDSTRAVREARTALSMAPKSELAVLTLAQVQPDKNEALKTLSDYLKANPKSREVRLAYARFLVEEKRFDAARAEFTILLKEQPGDLTVLYAMGLLAAQHNDLNGAEKYLGAYVKGLAAQPDDERDPTQALLILSQIAEQRGDTAAALKWLEQVPAGAPQSWLLAQIKRAQLMAKSGDLDGARRVLHEAKTEDKEEALQLIVAEAQILREANHAQEGLDLLDAALKNYPDNVDLLYDHAMMAEKLNRLDVMESSLRRIIQLDPKNQNAYNALGYSLAERNLRLDEAQSLVEKAHELAPNDPFIIDSLGWVQFRRGNLKEAETLLRRAYRMRPDPEIAAHLGEVLWALGQRDDARKLWREASNKDPKNDTLKSTLGRLQVHL
ncbi:tetratricopeptide repeat protein [Noviherbaspirillum pedocola]|uniref:tetratricopeptide repeat protein n=1 Tax=Noviherbaspirillum pedocola TaxID=2801341 RepID=UPI001F1F9FD7|nr:tetratricopeptide repeat protein [Noviherbaspirillum pedocola]